MDLGELAQRCRQGDALAWEAIVRKMQSRVFALAYSYLHHREEALDLAQEIFIRVFENLDQCRDFDAFKSWLLALARHTCLDRLRRLKARPHAPSDTENLNLTVDAPNPEEHLHLDRRKKMIYRAMAQLSLANREMIILKEIQGLKFREIAQMLKVPEGTVKSRSGRARVALAKAVLKIDPKFQRDTIA